MPISRENRDRYPPRKEWKAIRARILARAGHRCEGSPAYPDCRRANYSPLGGRWNKLVVLTIAHLDHTPEHNDDDNLRAWCQRCHLTYDAKHHAKNAAVTRRKRLNNGELFT